MRDNLLDRADDGQGGNENGSGCLDIVLTVIALIALILLLQAVGIDVDNLNFRSDFQ